MRDDGQRIGRFSVPRWLVRAGLGLATVTLVANVALISDYASLRRDQLASVTGPAEIVAAPDADTAGRDERTASDQRTPSQAATTQRMVAETPPSAPPAAGSDQRGPSEQPATVPDQLAAAREELTAVRQQLAAAREQLTQKTRTLEPLERRLAEVREEVRGWDGLHAAILKPLSGERRAQATAAERGRGKAEGTGIEAVTALLNRVREESHRLRALALVTREAASIISAVPSRLPLRAAITSGLGMRADPFGGSPQFHAGIDLAAPTGTPVAAAAGGVVLLAGAASGYGNTVVLDHGRGFETRYGHLDVIRVAKGQRVERGQPIGLSGNTGRSTGPHLHYEVLVDGRPVDPRRLLRD